MIFSVKYSIIYELSLRSLKYRCHCCAPLILKIAWNLSTENPFIHLFWTFSDLLITKTLVFDLFGTLSDFSNDVTGLFILNIPRPFQYTNPCCPPVMNFLSDFYSNENLKSVHTPTLFILNILRPLQYRHPYAPWSIFKVTFSYP